MTIKSFFAGLNCPTRNLGPGATVHCCECEYRIVRAFQPGDVVFLLSKHAISNEAVQRFYEHADMALEGTGIKIFLIGDGLEIAGREETVQPTEGVAPSSRYAAAPSESKGL